MVRTDWLASEVDGLRVRSWLLVGVAIAAVVLGFGAWWTYGLGRGPMATAGGQMGGMGGMGGRDAASQAPRFPPVTGYYDGQRIFFVHTEASDTKVAGMLTDMMGSPVPVVPTLAQVPDTALADLYVFTNGIKPDIARGPLGYQPDVFATAPGDRDYTPLTQITLVTWDQQSRPRLLTSTAQIQQAAQRGALELQHTDTVVNTPLLTWPGGHR